MRTEIRDTLSQTAAMTNDFLKRKLESLAEFAAGAGHEINNPLATISGRVQLLLRNETDPEKRRALETIGGQAYRIRDMIGDLMLFARPPAPDPKTLELAGIVRSVRDQLDRDADSRGCRIEIDADPPIPVWADEVQLQIVLSQLIRNSLEALSDGGDVSVSCRPRSNDGCQVAEIVVSDRGVGLSPTDREHLFDPFYSGRQAGRGLGFGLSKCWRIVSNHGGRIDVDSQSGGMTTFRVTWPATSDAAGLPANRAD
ncbi:MAG: HAMP domain-containing histidine kinase [Planctomycetes bacterium]|nr:HAMP domain-containing histidine kinase [Planctomycetota bacterium]